MTTPCHIHNLPAMSMLRGPRLFPAARIAAGLERLGCDVRHLPLSAYRTMSFYTMWTDALDRFGARLEQRFTRVQIRQMMEAAGLKDIRFSDSVPYWCAVGIKG